MIFQKEIATIAEKAGVPKSTIDKDWVLGHFLAAIYAKPELNDALIFKGGTCLKKCWFPDYRFSEDLDFTTQSETFELTHKHVTSICSQLKTNAKIQTHPVSLRPVLYENKLTGYEAVIAFWGADHPMNEAPAPPERWHSKVKIEITQYEKLLFPSVYRSVFHNYSDTLTLGNKPIACYAIEEVLSEKIRALIQRLIYCTQGLL